MIKKNILKIFVALICHALAYSPLINAAQLSLPSGDLVAPEITQPEYVGTVVEGSSHVVSVNVTDNVAVKQVVLYYRVIGAKNYQRKLMRSSLNADKYQASISADKIKKPGIEYYVQAMDAAGNTLLHGYSFSPLSVKTVASGEVVANDKSAMASDVAVSDDDSIFTNKWFWIGVGVLVAGAAAASGGGGGGGGEPTATLTINAGEPVN